MSLINTVLSSVHPKWIPLLNTPYNGRLLTEILDETLNKIIATGTKLCPDDPTKILKCLSGDPDLIKVVLVGQEPYPQPGIATGYSFACTGKPQPSLEIIMREMADELGIFDWNDFNFNTDLQQWVDQGVVLLNVALSCEEWKPKTHIELWKEFMSGLIKVLNDFKITQPRSQSLVFVFIGKVAQEYSDLVLEPWHYKINCNHPAAEKHGSVKFTGWFNQTNSLLKEAGLEKIEWAELKRKEIDWND